MEKTEMKEVNMGMFIIPNSGMNLKYAWDQEQVKRLNRNLGIPVHEDDDLFQVWIHGCGRDNLTDHGIPKDVRKILGIEGDEMWNICAPDLVPFSAFENVKEGDTVTFTAPSGAKVHVKCEQLPYRYRNFGKFETVKTLVLGKTIANNHYQEETKKKFEEKTSSKKS